MGVYLSVAIDLGNTTLKINSVYLIISQSMSNSNDFVLNFIMNYLPVTFRSNNYTANKMFPSDINVNLLSSNRINHYLTVLAGHGHEQSHKHITRL